MTNKGWFTHSVNFFHVQMQRVPKRATLQAFEYENMLRVRLYSLSHLL